MKQLTREEAIAFHESGEWQDMRPIDRARFQLEQRKLCMPFGVFHEAMEEALGRPVWTHEFAKPDILKAEFYERIPKQTMGQIMARLIDR